MELSKDFSGVFGFLKLAISNPEVFRKKFFRFFFLIFQGEKYEKFENFFFFGSWSFVQIRKNFEFYFGGFGVVEIYREAEFFYFSLKNFEKGFFRFFLSFPSGKKFSRKIFLERKFFFFCKAVPYSNVSYNGDSVHNVLYLHSNIESLELVTQLIHSLARSLWSESLNQQEALLNTVNSFLSKI